MTHLLKTDWLNKSHEQTQRSEVEECAPPKGKRVNIRYYYRELGFLAGASGKEPSCQCRRHKRHRSDPWVGKIPRRRKQQPTPVFLPGESHGQRSLVGYSPWGHKGSDTSEVT